MTDAAIRWYVHCGCPHHGDHLGCDQTCDDDGCQHPVGADVTAATEAEADSHVHGPGCWETDSFVSSETITTGRWRQRDDSPLVIYDTTMDRAALFTHRVDAEAVLALVSKRTAALDELTTALDAYEDEVGDRGMPFVKGWNRIGDAVNRINELVDGEREKQMLIPALRFYADPAHYETDGPDHDSVVQADCGQLARRTLGEAEKEKTYEGRGTTPA